MLQTEGELTKSHKAQCNTERKTKSRMFDNPPPFGGLYGPWLCDPSDVRNSEDRSDTEKIANGRGSDSRLKPNR